MYGFFLYFQVYWLKKSEIKLKGYGKIYIRQNSFDKEIFNQMFIFKQYDFHTNGPIKTIVDLGGNNGMSAIYFHYTYPEATVYALEPDKNNFAALVKQTSGIDKILPLNKAIWKENGVINLDSGDSWAVRIDMDGSGNPAEAISMDSLINTYDINQIDILKIDIEGSEKDLFANSTRFLSITKNLVIELHDWLSPGCAQPFFKSLANYSYTYAVSRENTLITDLQAIPNDYGQPSAAFKNA